MKVLKFGGSSLATPDNVRRAIAIVERAAKESPVRSVVTRSVVTAVVVSAFGGVTDDLEAAAGAAARHDEGYRESCAALRARHLDAARELAGGSAGDLAATIEERFGDVSELGDRLKAKCARSPFYGMGSAKDVVDDVVIDRAGRHCE